MFKWKYKEVKDNTIKWVSIYQDKYFWDASFN